MSMSIDEALKREQEIFDNLEARKERARLTLADFFPEDWNDPEMDIYDRVYADHPDTQYTDASQFMSMYKERTR